MTDVSTPTFRGAIFDMDGLLLDSEPFWQEAERDAFALAGVHLSDVDLCQTIGMRIDEVASYWFARRPWDRQLWPEAYLVETVIERVIALVQERGTPLPGVVATLNLLQQAGLRLALASSSSMRIIEPALSALQLSSYFAVVHSAEAEPHGKPHPGVYVTAAAQLGLAPRHCFALEDSVAGLRAAQAAGIKCLVVPEPRLRDHPDMRRADLVLDSLVDFDLASLARLTEA